MKNFFKPIIAFSLFALTLSSCSNDDSILEIPATSETQIENNLSETEAAILNHIKQTHPQSRSNNPSMIPYIVDGETVFYVVNYDGGGWEIYSNDIHVPMLIMKSETGNFYPGAPFQEEVPFMFVLEQAAETIHDILDGEIEVSDEPDSSWMPYLTNTMSINEPEWQLLPKQGIDYEFHTYMPEGGRLNTRWGSEPPYNSYTKLVQTANNHYVLAPVGCGAVAVGQYLYWHHYHHGTPETYPNTAKAISNRYKGFEFSGESTEWDSIYSNSSPHEFMYEPPTAIFLGYIAKLMDTKFEVDNSTSLTADILSTLKRLLNENSSTGHKLNPAGVSISSCLQKGYPLIGSSFKNSDSKHTYIIDFMHSEIQKTYKYWVYKEWSDGDDTEEDPLGDYDSPSLEQVIEVYGEENVRCSTYINTFSWIKINWGSNDGSYDNVMINTEFITGTYVPGGPFPISGLDIIAYTN